MGNEYCWGRLMNEARMVENQGQRLRAGSSRVLSHGAESLSPPFGCLEEQSELPQWGSGWSRPQPPKGFPLFQHSAIITLPDTIILLIIYHKKLNNSYPIQPSVNYCAFGELMLYDVF